MNAYTKLSNDFDMLARNLSKIEIERRDRNQRVTQKRNEVHLAEVRTIRDRRIRQIFWWVSPISWAVVFVAGFFMTDWFWQSFDGLLAKIGL
jgi:hypothetical protein